MSESVSESPMPKTLYVVRSSNYLFAGFSQTQRSKYGYFKPNWTKLTSDSYQSLVFASRVDAVTACASLVVLGYPNAVVESFSHV